MFLFNFVSFIKWRQSGVTTQIIPKLNVAEKLKN